MAWTLEGMSLNKYSNIVPSIRTLAVKDFSVEYSPLLIRLLNCVVQRVALKQPLRKSSQECNNNRNLYTPGIFHLYV